MFVTTTISNRCEIARSAWRAACSMAASCAARRRQDRAMARAGAGVVVENAVCRRARWIEHGIAENATELIGARRAVQASADDDGDVVVAHTTGGERFEQRRQQNFVRDRPRD